MSDQQRPAEQDRPASDQQRPVEQDQSGGVVDCPACGAANSDRRVLCGRCGADLATGEPTGVSQAPAAPRAPRQQASPRRPPAADPESEGDRTARTVGLVVAVGVLAGGVLGALVALDAGPFAEGPTAAPRPVFDPAVYSGAPEPIEITGVDASSTLAPLGGERFDAALMTDGDIRTAWNNAGSAEPDGVGVRIRLRPVQPVWVTALVVANGDQADDPAFLGNARAREMRLLLSGGATFDLHLLDRQGRQRVDLPAPTLTTEVLLVVDRVFAGDTQDDLALSEIEVIGHPAAGTDVEAAQRLEAPDA